MDEFATTMRNQATETLRRDFRQEAPHGTDPVLELIGFLLSDGAGDVLPLPENPVTTEQWLMWNRLALQAQPALVRMMTRELNREKIPLPAEKEAMQTWAARLLLSTLDRLGML